MEKDTRRNILTYYFNFLVVAIVGFIVNPLLLGGLGPVLFGVWKSLQRYLDFATVADGRASQALKWIVAHRSKLTDDERRRDIGGAVVIWFRWLPAAVLVAVAIAIGAPLLVKGIPVEARSVSQIAAAVLAANTVLAGLLALPDSVLNGTNQGYRSMLINTIVFTISNILMVVAAYAGLSLWSLAVIVLVMAVLNAACTLLVARRCVPWWGINRPTAADIRRMQGYTAWTLGWVVVDKLLLACELIIISIMLGAVYVTKYTFTSYVMQFVISIALVTASGFMPALGSQLGASQHSDAATRAKSVRHLVIAVAALGGSAVLAFNQLFVSVWAGASQFLGPALNALLVLSGLQVALIRMDGQILDVTLRIAPKVTLGFVSCVGGILAGCLAYSLAGNLSIALIAVIAVRMISSIGFPVLVARSIHGSGVPKRAIMLSIALLAVSLCLGQTINPHQPLMTGFTVAAWLALTCALCWFGIVPRDTIREIVFRKPLT